MFFSRFRSTLQVLILGMLLGIGQPLSAQTDAYRELFEAVSMDDSATIRKLLVRGVSPNATNADKLPAILLAGQVKSFSALKALLESPLTDVNARSPHDETALMLVSLHGELEMARLLLKRGAEVNKTGWTPLHYAALAGHLEIVELLLENHAYIDSPSPNGTTPLMMAAREKRTTIAQHLVAQGADPSLRNEAGLGAPEYFLRSGEPELSKWMADKASEFLRKYGTPSQPVSAGGASPNTGASGLPVSAGAAAGGAAAAPVTTHASPPSLGGASAPVVNPVNGGATPVRVPATLGPAIPTAGNAATAVTVPPAVTMPAASAGGGPTSTRPSPSTSSGQGAGSNNRPLPGVRQ